MSTNTPTSNYVYKNSHCLFDEDFYECWHSVYSMLRDAGVSICDTIEIMRELRSDVDARRGG